MAHRVRELTTLISDENLRFSPFLLYRSRYIAL